MSSLKENRQKVKKALSILVGAENSTKAEKTLFEQISKISEMLGEDLVALYEKLSFEKLGELYELPENKRIVYLETEDTNILWESGIYKDFKEKQDERRAFQVLMTTGGIQMSDFSCTKCRQKTVTFYTLQTRSGDEGVTVYFTCVSCGHKYK